MDKNKFISNEKWEHFLKFSKGLKTPFVAIDLDIIRQNYSDLRKYFPYADVYYAVKANPNMEVISTLKDLGSSFDIASVPELDKVLSLGADVNKLSYGNTIKKAEDIEYFYKKNVKLFATDSEADLRNIAKFAPGSRIYVRLIMENSSTADWPLSRKFGCDIDMAYDLLVLAKELNLVPYGVSFHVGSQQRDISQWDNAISRVKSLFTKLKEKNNIELQLINMGGGFPASYLQPTSPLTEYANVIEKCLKNSFDKMPRIILEPGRSIAGNSGILVAEVILISKKTNKPSPRWVYLDAGLFNGLEETIGESIKYPIFTEKDGKNSEEVIMAGPTCDSMDILYEDYKYKLPIDLKIGDRIYFLSAGAYTSSYASVEFNGFKPIETYIIK